jgi:hypothetical protein
VQQLRAIYISDIDLQRRRAFGRMQMFKKRSSDPRGTTAEHGVMVPGVTCENSMSGTAADVAAHGGRPRSYKCDVKRGGFLEHLHSPTAGRGVPMQRRTDSVRKEWIRKAAEADRVWSRFPKGAGGPIQRRFRSSAYSSIS